MGNHNCWVCVKPDELVAVEQFGKFVGIRNSGCHCIGCDVGGAILKTKKISTRVQEYSMNTETKTKDNVFVKIVVAVQVEVMLERAYEAIYKLSQPSNQIESYVADVVRGQVPKMMLDDLFESKDEIAQAVQERLSKAMQDYGWKIHQVLIVDLRPDDKVRVAMNEIDANRRLRVAATEKAEADKVLKVKSAEADAESKFLQGQGVARQRTAIVEGLKHAVGGGQHLTAETTQELLLITQYFDTLEKLSNGNSTTVFMPHTVGNLKNIANDIRNGTKQAAAPNQSSMNNR
jgi:regulator of protease activity HflC (stomatin/prohibitin superfamily)